MVPKGVASGENTFAAGDKVYYDSGDGNVNSASSGNTLCGRALEAAVAADTEVLIDLDGTSA